MGVSGGVSGRLGDDGPSRDESSATRGYSKHFDYNVGFWESVRQEWGGVFRNPYKFDLAGRDWRELIAVPWVSWCSSLDLLVLRTLFCIMVWAWGLVDMISSLALYGPQAYVCYLTIWVYWLTAITLTWGSVLHFIARRSLNTPIPTLPLPRKPQKDLVQYQQLLENPNYCDALGTIIPNPGNPQKAYLEPACATAGGATDGAPTAPGRDVPLKGWAVEERTMRPGKGGAGDLEGNQSVTQIGPQAPWWVAAYVSLDDVAKNLNLLVTVFFWILIFPTQKEPVSGSTFVDHILPILSVGSVSLLSRTPSPAYMIWHTGILALCYVVNIFVVYAVGYEVGMTIRVRGAIYGVLNFDKRPATAWTICAMALTVFPLGLQFVHTATQWRQNIIYNPKRRIGPPPSAA